MPVAAIENVTMGTEAWDDILNEYAESFELDRSPVVLLADSAMNPIIESKTCEVVATVEKKLESKTLTKKCPSCVGGVWNGRTCHKCGGSAKVASKWGKIAKRLASHKKLILALDTNQLPKGYRIEDCQNMLESNEKFFKAL
ncbi:hypothetical protein VP501E541_P0155 [Vibrio phage 501E54-1]|nr:hypothetical protein VP501E541_P0155 [Vibrio phage 501E54-1]